jgi:hypothetical protein
MFASLWNDHAYRFQLFAEPGAAMEQHGTEARLDFGIFYLAVRETVGRHVYVWIDTTHMKDIMCG